MHSDSTTRETASQLLTKRLMAWLGRSKPETTFQHCDELKAALCTTIGSRAENQDRALMVRFLSERPGESFFLYGLCDGLGGMRDGGRCAELALSWLVAEIMKPVSTSRSDHLKRAVRKASEVVNGAFNENGGTTMSVVWFTAGGLAYCANVGDSRIYQSDLKQGLKQISRDDNIASQVQQLDLRVGGGVSPLIAKQLTQFVGMEADFAAHSFFELKPADGPIILTSDGSHQIGAQLFERIVLNSGSISEVPRKLVTVARWLGTKDNATALAAELSSPDLVEQLRTPGSGICEIWDTGAKLEFVWGLEVSPTAELAPDSPRTTIRRPKYRRGQSKPDEPQLKSKSADRTPISSHKVTGEIELKLEDAKQ